MTKKNEYKTQEKARRTKTKNGLIYHEYYIELFRVWVSVIIPPNRKKLIEAIDYCGMEAIPGEFSGCAREVDGGKIVVLLDKEEGGKSIEVLAHEFVHVITMIFAYIGIHKQTISGQDEVEAYLMTLLIEKFKHLVND